MEVIRDGDGCPSPPEGTALTIGFFDGVHLGHSVVIGEVRRLAAELGSKSAVVTFDPHPATVVRPESAPKLLTDLDQRLELLAATGVDYALLVHFDAVRAKEAPEDFVREVLVDCLAARAVVVGADFHFGRDRGGDVALLRAMGATHGFEVDGVQLLASAASGAKAVSSTTIRGALAEGDVESAARMLGRPYEVRGVVEHGDHRGRELGFPTANVAVAADRCMPADGIYAGWYVRPDGTRHMAAVSLGRRLQFYDEAAPQLLEAHLLDAEVDLYGQRAGVQLVRRLRGEQRFDSVDELVVQIRADVDETRRVLSPA